MAAPADAQDACTEMTAARRYGHDNRAAVLDRVTDVAENLRDLAAQEDQGEDRVAGSIVRSGCARQHPAG